MTALAGTTFLESSAGGLAAGVLRHTVSWQTSALDKSAVPGANYRQAPRMVPITTNATVRYPPFTST